jgi:hypothetical protein
MTIARFLRHISLSVVCLALLPNAAVLGQRRANNEPDVGGCERELEKLGEGVPAWPPISKGAIGGGVWIGEVLIDALGKVSNVWTIRPVRLTPPSRSLSKAITDAVRKWEFAPFAVDNVPEPVCQTITVNVNLDLIRRGR